MSKKKKNDREEGEIELPYHWQRIQGALWLLGLALIAWQGWWWPGILVLAALSGLLQAALQLYFSRQEEAKTAVNAQARLQQERTAWLPSVCPNCGAPLSVATAHWTGPDTADCPYCKANLKKPA